MSRDFEKTPPKPQPAPPPVHVPIEQTETTIRSSKERPGFFRGAKVRR